MVGGTVGSAGGIVRSRWAAFAPYSPLQSFQFKKDGTMNDDESIQFHIVEEGMGCYMVILEAKTLRQV